MAEPHVDFHASRVPASRSWPSWEENFPQNLRLFASSFRVGGYSDVCHFLFADFSKFLQSYWQCTYKHFFSHADIGLRKISSLKISKTCGGQNRLGYSWQQCVDCGKPWWWYSSKDWWVGPRKPHLIMGITRASPTPKVQRWYLHCGVNQQQTVFPGRGALAPWISTAGTEPSSTGRWIFTPQNVEMISISSRKLTYRKITMCKSCSKRERTMDSISRVTVYWGTG